MRRKGEGFCLFAREDPDWGKFVAVFHAFFDESGKSHDPSPAVVNFSGFIATKKDWEELERKWERALRRHGLDAFHFVEHHSKPEIIREFIYLTKRFGERGISVSVEADKFKMLGDPLRKALCGASKKTDDAHYLAFKFVVLYLISRIHYGDFLTFTSDEDEGTTEEIFRWYKALKATEVTAKARLVSFGIADDEAFPQLQAADLLAALGRDQARLRLTGESKYQEYFDYLRKPEEQCYLAFQTAVLDDVELKALASHWDSAMAQFVESGKIGSV